MKPHEITFMGQNRENQQQQKKMDVLEEHLCELYKTAKRGCFDRCIV